jgi:hypothetical protein
VGTVWATVDRLIHDLGEVRAVVDEVESLPEAAVPGTVVGLRGALDDATDAITRIFTDTRQETVEAGWRAMARAQDAARGARAQIEAARTMRNGLKTVASRAYAQAARAQQHREQLAERPWFRRPHDPPKPDRDTEN